MPPAQTNASQTQMLKVRMVVKTMSPTAAQLYANRLPFFLESQSQKGRERNEQHWTIMMMGVMSLAS